MEVEGARMCHWHRVGGTPAPNPTCLKPSISEALGLGVRPEGSRWHKRGQICPQNATFPAPSRPTSGGGLQGTPSFPLGGFGAGLQQGPLGLCSP